MARPLMRFMKTPAQGAVTSIYLASSPDVAAVTGRYFANSKPKTSNKSSYDTDRGEPALAGQRRPRRPHLGPTQLNPAQQAPWP